MSICKHCGQVGGWHMEDCPIRHVTKPYVTTVYPAPITQKDHT